MMRPFKWKRVGAVVGKTLMLGLMEMVAENGRRYTGVVQSYGDPKRHSV